MGVFLRKYTGNDATGPPGPQILEPGPSPCVFTVTLDMSDPGPTTRVPGSGTPLF